MNHKIFIKSAKLPFEQNNVYKIKKHLCWKILNYLFEKPNIKKKIVILLFNSWSQAIN